MSVKLLILDGKKTRGPRWQVIRVDVYATSWLSELGDAMVNRQRIALLSSQEQCRIERGLTSMKHRFVDASKVMPFVARIRWPFNEPSTVASPTKMRRIRCTNCNSRLKLPESFEGGQVKCPKCGTQLSTSEHLIPSESRIADAMEPPRSVTPESESNPAAEVTPDQDAVMVAAAVQQVQRASKRPPAFDFRFKRYWTPVIIRFSWYVVLILAALWIVFLSVAFVGAWTSGSDASMLDSFGLSDLSVSSLDLEGIMGGKADVDSLNEFLDNVTEQGSAGTSLKPKKTTYQSIMSFGFTTLGFLTTIATMILSVLFFRVFFESIIVLFDMSSTLKSIEEKADLR